MSLPALRTQAIRAQASRNAFVRSYATPAFEKAANGIAIAAADEGKPTSSISIIARAGSRFEPAPGVAHVLKNSVFKVRPPSLASSLPRTESPIATLAARQGRVAS